MDPNFAIGCSMAIALGFVARLVSHDVFSKLMAHLQKLYTESDATNVRKIVATTVHEISKHASDQYRACTSEMIPLMFYGVYDASDEIAEIWKEAWEETTSGTKNYRIAGRCVCILFISRFFASMI
jgi:proteasome component ECM29